jgi:pyruvate dehydrogenase E1 component
MRQVPDQISQWVEQDYTSLGTDGFGLSDTRDAVRRYFHVDAESIVVAALDQLARTGAVGPGLSAQARERYGWRG